MLQSLVLDPAQESERITGFIQGVFERTGRSVAVIGLSGGIDSALVATLAARALGAECVHALLMPYCTSDPRSEADGRLVAEQLQITAERYEITSATDAFCGHGDEVTARRKGNIMARCRMTALYDLAAARDGLVLGTSNRTETLLGYFTLHGDAAADIKPIAHLFKCQVRQLARHLGVPEIVIDKAPSADLWTGQTDEGELGFTYDEADQVLWLLTEQGASAEDMAARGFDPAAIQAIERRMHSMAYKVTAVPSLSGRSI
jgi:NAD+ synthase